MAASASSTGAGAASFEVVFVATTTQPPNTANGIVCPRDGRSSK